VWFYRTSSGPNTSAVADAPTPQRREGRTLAIDVRGLEPPQPMVRILEAIDGLSAGDRLEILHERRPIFLYPQLEDRGFLHETSEPAPGLVRIVIRRRDL
jgi:tRNA 2-thiouridine synthesizing protein A